MADIKYSEMSTISGASIDNGSLVAVADVDVSSETGYSTYATTVLDVSMKINKHTQYATDLSAFTNQTVFGALNELKAGGGGGSSTLAGLTDVAISSPTDSQVLKYNGTSGKWENGTGGGGSADYVELTYAQYQALSDAQKKNGKMYFITDINGNGDQFQPVIYSTAEREIGVWTDGRPLYQKTISMGTLPNKTTKAVEHGISNIDVTAIVSLMAMASNGTYAMFPRIHDSQVNAQIFFEVNSTYITCYGRGQDQSGWTTCYVTIQYCKTTDTAGSGIWTPQGVPAVHYSTDERVVGTWVDGRTVYEKTLYNAGGVSGTLNIPHNITNLDIIISCEGQCSDVNGSDVTGRILPRIGGDGNHIGINSYTSTNIVVTQANAFSTRLRDYYITIRYVKTAS
jgi:hypothetical protein